MNRPSPTAMRNLRKRDPALAAAMKRVPVFPGFPTPQFKRRSAFHHLARAIAYQQLAGKAAATIFGRGCALTAGPAFPKPEEFLKIPKQKVRACGFSEAKFLALRDLAQHVADGRLKVRSLWRYPDDEVIEQLVAVRGIGVWSAQMFLMFQLGRLDVMPSTDLGVQNGAVILDGLKERPKPKELEARAEAWAPLRSVAAWTLWRLTDTPK